MALPTTTIGPPDGRRTQLTVGAGAGEEEGDAEGVSAGDEEEAGVATAEGNAEGDGEGFSAASGAEAQATMRRAIPITTARLMSA